MNDLEIIILGSGTSHGVPMIGCHCAVCTSNDPHDRRTRPSVWLRAKEVHLLIDTAPELRLQCLANGIDRVDAVLFTHHHADHVCGLDDLRRFNHLSKKKLPCYGTQRTIDGLRRMFSYAFEHAPNSPHSKPEIDLIEIDETPFHINGVEIIPIPLMHGPMPVLGFRIGSFAYCTDCSFIAGESFALLDGVQCLILDALRQRSHPTHFNVAEAVAAARRVGAKQTWFTHIAHELPHATTNAELPCGIALGHDGLRIALP